MTKAVAPLLLVLIALLLLACSSLGEGVILTKDENGLKWTKIRSYITGLCYEAVIQGGQGNSNRTLSISNVRCEPNTPTAANITWEIIQSPLTEICYEAARQGSDTNRTLAVEPVSCDFLTEQPTES